ncbi:MAG: ribulose-phosphate 3-epimerase, partial [Thermoplasma acidophilum]|nr:ribulose-phosphate 3-epimerase [Thermoplasma acidophilum]
SDKIHEASVFIKKNGLKTKIEVDGGINDNTARIVKNAGADIVVSASYIFGGNISERIRTLSSI